MVRNSLAGLAAHSGWCERARNDKSVMKNVIACRVVTLNVVQGSQLVGSDEGGGRA